MNHKNLASTVKYIAWDTFSFTLISIWAPWISCLIGSALFSW